MGQDITIERLFEIVKTYSDEELIKSMSEYLSSILNIRDEDADFVLIVLGLGENEKTMAITSSLEEEKNACEVVRVAHMKMEQSVKEKMN